ncbi:unnamed protein product [Blepharisma stoltei]|uniref:ABC transporter domain-containing protein n=1 Tax=Blepharisma stoltei TaxID=1481888 RepID=A0AAU9IS55_9CILI|nr:unnamed protein product [Blepharisma stoltei]
MEAPKNSSGDESENSYADISRSIECKSPAQVVPFPPMSIASHGSTIIRSPSQGLFNESGRSSIEPPSEVAIKLENVHKTYLIGTEGVAALRGVSFIVKKGEFVCILGTSGGGKTTLLNIMGTIDKPTKGHVWIFGSRIKANTRDSFLADLRTKRLAFVFQTFNLIASMTAIENVELPMLLYGKLSPSEIKTRARELLAKVGLEERTDHFPNQLSGGEQQRVTIARALANDPEILLLDEPTGDLDTKNTDIVMKILLDLNREGKTLIMVTHDVSLKSYAHKVVRVMDGKLIRQEEITEEERSSMIERHSEGKAALRTGTNVQLTSDMPRTTYRKPADYPALQPRVS